MEQQHGLIRRLLDRLSFNKGRTPRGSLPIHYLRQYDGMIDNAPPINWGDLGTDLLRDQRLSSPI